MKLQIDGGLHEYCKQEGLNYSGAEEEEEGSRGLRRARPPRAAAPLLRGALLRGGLEGVLVVKTCVSIWEAR